MSQLKLCLFGTPRFERQGRELTLAGRKVMALAAYLAVTGQPHHRDTLATLFWPDHDQSSARANLRRELSRLNKVLGPDYLVIDRDHAALTAQAGLALDIAQFQQLLAESQAHSHPPLEPCPTCLSLLAEAAALYTGDFMAGFTLPDCPEFDQWQFFQNEHLRQVLGSALDRLIQGYSGRGQFEPAILYAQRRVELDPLHEPAQRQLMQIYAWAGQQAAALRQYQECLRLFQAELGLSPSPETTQLYEAIKKKQVQPSLASLSPLQPTLRQAQGAAPEPVEGRSPEPVLPPQATPFIGRKQELAEVGHLLRAEPDCRLLTLLGPGGMGKTRLALQVASELFPAFADGVYFVPLASLGSAGFLTSTIAEALQLSFYGGTAPKVQLLNYLREKKLLLILDNFEQLLGDMAEEAPLLSELVRVAPGVKLLVTSRGRLNLQEEWIFEVGGLHFPEPPSTPWPSPGDGWAWAEEYSAIQLFLQAAHRARVDFHLSEEEGPSVVRICQLLDGLPLGLELAAAWVRLMSCREIAGEIERNLDFLATSLRNVPARHRSLRAVFEHSWQLLTPAERHIFQKLSVFHGSFSREAGEQVAGAFLPSLSALVDQSLLRRGQGGRYEIHELLRQYAAEKLAQAVEANEATLAAHARFYAAFLKEREADLSGERQIEALTELLADLDNIRAAWLWAVARRDLAVLGQAAASLWIFFEIRGQFQEGEAAFRQAATALDGLEEAGGAPEQNLILGQLLGRQGWFANRLGFFEQSLALQQRSVSLLRQAGPAARSELAWALTNLGQTCYFQDGYDRARQLMQEALRLATVMGDRGVMAFALHCLGQTAEFQGEYREAEPYFQESIHLFQQTGERRLRAFALNNWGRAAYAMGAYAQARALIDEAMELRRALGDRIGIAYSLLDLGKLAKAEGDYGQARALIQESLQISTELGGEDLMARCLNSLGLVAGLVGENEQAEMLLKKSLSLYWDIGDESRVPLVLNNLGYLAYRRGAYRQAEQYLQQSLSLCRQRDKRGELASALRYLGYVSASTGRPAEARHYFRQTLGLVTQTGAAPIILDVVAGWAALLLQGSVKRLGGDVLKRLGGDGTSPPSEAAATLLALVQAHPAAEYETRRRAEQLLAELPPEGRDTSPLPSLEQVTSELLGTDYETA